MKSNVRRLFVIGLCLVISTLISFLMIDGEIEQIMTIGIVFLYVAVLYNALMMIGR